MIAHLIWFWVLLSAASIQQVSQNAFPAGGEYPTPKQVTVRVLSILKPTWIDVSALPGRQLQLQVSMEDGQTKKVSLTHMHLRCGAQAPIEILPKDGKPICAASVAVKSGAGLLRIQTRKQMSRVYAGQLLISERAGQCLILNKTPLEEYVSSVTCREMRGGGIQALLAQAVLVRTWYLNNRKKHASSGFEVCDLTHCQVYTGHNACSDELRAKLSEVLGLVLFYKGQPAQVAYFSTCGGHTAQADEIWGPGSARVYLQGVSDSDSKNDFCAESPHWRWRFEIGRADFCNQIRKILPTIGSGECELVAHAGRGGWNREVIISAQRSQHLRGETFHMLMGRLVGWGKFKSANFQVRPHKDRFVFVGKGLGHGVGMCQYGALGLAQRGATYQQILSHYFPHTQIGRLP